MNWWKKVKGRKMAGDSYADPNNNRGSSRDRTTTLRGSGRHFDNSKLKNDYQGNGVMQQIVNRPAHDATREWIDLVMDSIDVSEQTLIRLEELKLKEKLREAIKWSRVFRKGAGLFYGVQADNVDNQRNLGDQMPSKIRKIDYINVLSNPNLVQITIDNTTEPTMRNFNVPTFTIANEVIHPSRMAWIANEWDPDTLEGISVVEVAFDAVAAQDTALWSTSSLLQVISILGFKSEDFVEMTLEEKIEYLAHMKAWMDTQSVIGLGKDEELSRVNADFGGLKDAYEFVWQSVSAYSIIPVSVIIGRMQGILTAADEDAVNYYSGISQFQELTLRRIIQQVIDLVHSETEVEPGKSLRGSKPTYKMTFNSLWKMSPIAQAEIEAKNSERDSKDVGIGKISATQARELDPRTSHLALEDPKEDDPEPEPIEGGEPAAGEGDNFPSIEVDGMRVGAAYVAWDRQDILGGSIHVPIQDPGEFQGNSFRMMIVDDKLGVSKVIGRKPGADKAVDQSYLFQGDQWDSASARNWIQEHLKREISPEAIDGVPMQFDVDTAAALKAVDIGEDVIKVRVKSPKGFDHGSFVLKQISENRMISLLLGQMKGGDGLASQSYWFDRKKWSAADAEEWVRKQGQKPI